MIDVDFADGKFRVPVERWEALRESVEGLLGARNWRVQARRLASITGMVLSMHLSWGPVTQLHTRHLYALINSVRSLNGWVTLTEGAMNELLLWQGLPRDKVEGKILPAPEVISIRMALDAITIGWGGHTIENAPQYAREYFSAEESSQSSTYGKLLIICMYLQAMSHVCAGKLVLF